MTTTLSLLRAAHENPLQCSVADWAVAYEAETGDVSMRQIEALPVVHVWIGARAGSWAGAGAGSWAVVKAGDEEG